VIAVPATPRELPHRGQHEEPSEPIDRPEQHQEVRALQPWRLVAERDRRDQQRKPAQPQREQELADELRTVRVRGSNRRDERLARQDDHVADLLQERTRRREGSVGYSSEQRW
jgi:hypothetical protein